RSNHAVYRSALPGVDVRYDVEGHTLKESLVLRNAAAPRAFAYRIRMSHGLRARSTGTGRIDVLTSTGARLLSFAPPFMVDSSRDRRSWQRVALHLHRTADGFQLELRLNRRWLSA